MDNDTKSSYNRSSSDQSLEFDITATIKHSMLRSTLQNEPKYEYRDTMGFKSVDSDGIQTNFVTLG